MNNLYKNDVSWYGVVWKTLLVTAVLFAFSFTTANAQGETCVDPIVVNALPFNDSGNTGDYGNNYTGADVAPEASGGIFDGTGSTSYLDGFEAVYSYTPSKNEIITISTSLNSSDWHSIYVFTGCPFTSTVGYHTSTSGDSRIIENLPVTLGETYYILVSNWYSVAVDYTINIEEEIPDCPLLGLNIGDPCDDGDPDTINDVVTADCECEGILPPDGMVCEAPIVINSLPYTDTDNTENFGDNYGSSDMPTLAVGAIGSPSSSYLNGDDVVYAYTPIENRIIDVSVTDHGSWAGLFVFTGCQFSSTVGGHTSSSSTLDLEVNGLPVVAGETYYFVISTFATPQSTPYTIEVIDVTPSCMAPTALTSSNITTTTADIEWTSGNVETSWNISWGEPGYTPGGEDELGTATASAASYHITGLTPEATYDVYIQADCGATDGASDWVGAENFTTLPTCPAPITLATTDISATTADIEWTAGDAETAWNISWGTPGYTPGDGDEINTATASANSYQITGLTEQTEYDVYVQADCGAVDGVSTWTGPLNFETACAAIADMFEDFDSYNTGNIVPDCWERMVPATSVGSQSISSTSPASGDRNIYQYTGSTSNPVIVVLPEFDNVNAETHWLRFKARVSSGAPGTLSVGYVTDINDYDNFSLIEDLSITNTSYTADDAEYIVQIPSSLPTNARLAIKNAADAKSYYWDDVSWEEIPSCIWPTALATTSISATTADIEWTAGDAETTWNITWGEPGYIPGETGRLGADLATTTTYQISELTGATSYEVYVQAECGATDGVSTWTGPLSITTLCDSFVIPYTEDFDSYGTGSDAFPDCWTRPVTYDSGWSGIFPSIITYSGSNRLRFQSLTTEPTYAISPAFAEDINDLRVSFMLRREGDNSGTIDVGVMSDANDISTFELVATIDPNDNIFNEYVYDLNQVNLSGSDNFIAFRHNSNSSSWYYWLDDFEVDFIPTCPAPTDLAATNLTTTTADINWTAGSTETEWEVLYGEAGFDPENEGQTITISNDAETTLTGLVASTEYDFYVTAVCDVGDESERAGPESFTTLCDAIAIPYTEDFDTYGTGPESFPTCWERVTYTSGSNVWPSIVTYSGSNRLRFQSLTTEPTYAISPAFAEDINDLRVSFMLRREGDNSGTIDVGVMSDASDISTFELVATIDPANSVWLEHAFDLNQVQLSGPDNFIAFRHNSSLSSWYYWLDDFEVDFIPTCPAPTDLATTSVTTTTADIEWTAGSTETEWEVLYGEAGFNPESEGQTITISNDAETTLTGLVASTEYDFYVTAICDIGDESERAGPDSFTTLCEPGTIPFFEDFESGYTHNSTLSGCWSQESISGTQTWTVNETLTNYNRTPRSGDYNIFLRWSNEDWIFYPLELTGGTSYDLRFYARQDATSGADVEAAFGTTDDAAAMTTSIIPSSSVTSGDYQEFFGSFIPANDGVYYIGIKGTTTITPFYLSIDDISVDLSPTCPAPTDLAVDDTSIALDSVELSWTENGTASDWEVIYGLEGFDPEDASVATTVPVTTTAYTLTGLNHSTEYEVYVRAVCDATDKSFLDGPVYFATLCSVHTVPYSLTFEEGANCATVQNAGSGNNWGLVTGSSSGFDGIFARYLYDFSNAANAWLYTAEIALEAGVNYQISYKYGAAGYTEKMKVAYGIENIATSMTTELADHPNITGSTPNHNTIYFTVPANETYYFGFNAYSDANQNALYLDDIEITLAPTCLPPTDLMASNVTADSADITWNAGATETSWNISWGTPGYTPGDADEISTASASAESYQITGLTENTQYDVYVQADCSANDLSEWTGPVTLSTTQIPATLPYVDDFAINQFSFVNGTETNKWEYGSAAGNPSNAMYISNDGGASNAYSTGSASVVQAYRDIEIPADATLADFNFDWRAKGEGFISSNWDYFRVWMVPVSYIPTSGTQISSDTDRIQIGGNFNDQEDWDTYSNNGVDISTFAGQTMRLVFEWRNDSSGGTQPPAAIDNIHLELQPCQIPTDLTVDVASIGLDSVELSWTSNDSETEWEVRYGETGFDLETEGETVTVTADPETTLNNLTHSTTYDVYVRAVCAADDISEWSEPTSFTTLCVPGTVPFFEGFEDDYADNEALAGCWSQSGTEWRTRNVSDTHGREARTGNSYISLSDYSNGWIFYPLELTSGNTYNLSFYARQDNTAGASVMASFGDTDTEAAMTNEIIPSTTVDSGTYEEFSGTFAPDTDGVYYIGINGTTNIIPWYITIDDISVDVICEPVTDVTVTEVAHTTATVTWTTSALANDGYIVNVYEEGADITTATAVFTDAITDGSTTSSVTGLELDTKYDVYVTSICSETEDMTAISDVVTFTTENCEVVTDILASDVTYTDATLTWTGAASATDGYLVEVYEEDADTTTATPVFSDTVVAGVETIDVIGLQPDRGYDVYITSICDEANAISITSDVYTFNTPVVSCDAVTDLVVSATTETTATFMWTASASATEGYVVNVYEAGTTTVAKTEVIPDGNTTTIEVTGLDPDTDYETRVTSDCGFNETEVSDTVTFSTEGCNAVTDVVATNIGHATATIEWTEAAIPAANGYTVEVYEEGDTTDVVTTATAAAGETSAAITGLWPETAYDVYVTSECGYDTATAVMNTFTTEAVVCDAVTGITITDATPTGATLSWTDTATAVNGYVVEVYEAGADVNTATTVFDATLAAGVTTVNITGLTAALDGEDFDVYVTSDCGYDITETSAVETFTTLPVPCDPVMNVSISDITATSAVVSWDLTATATNGYVVNVYETGTTTNPVATVPVNTAVSAVGISGLTGSTATNSKHYDVYVTTNCDFDVTISSDVETFKTEDVACDVVADVTISAITQNGATVSWTGVTTAIDGYDVEVYEAGTTSLVAVESVGAGVTTAVLTNLPAATTGTGYDVYVVTKCGYNGATVVSTVESFTTLEVTCETVIASVDAFTQTTALVSWSGSGTAVGNFTIDVYLAGDDPLSDSPVVTGTAAVSATDYLVTGLDPATNYEVYVTSECDLGVETTSDEVAFTTDSCDEVSNLVVSNETQTTAMVTWEASATASDGYMLTLYEEGTEVSTQILAVGATSFELTGLDPATTYELMITSDCGEVTTDSALVEFTTDSCDAATDIAISDITLNSATVSWTASATASDGYEVNVYEAGTTNHVTTVMAASTDTSASLTGLDAGTAYDVVVTSDCGDVSMDAIAVSFTTLACDAVTDIVMSDITQTTATVTWTGSATASEGYVVNVYEAGTTNLVTTETAAAGETSVDLTGLDTATTYDVVITSDCDVVTVDSAPVSFTTMTCDAVVAIAYNITQTTATVMWTPSATAEEYIVTVTEGGTEVSSDIITGTSMNLTGLLPATTYEVIVTSDCGDVTVDSNLVTINTMSCDAATDVEVTAYTQTTATVTWTASATASDGYQVNVYEAGTTNLVTTETATAGATSVNITGLAADTAYDVVVTSDCGDMTVDSAPVSFTTDSCDAVTDVVISDITLTSATVSWTASATASDGYEVNVYEAGTTNLVTTETAAAGETSVDLTGLTADTAYDIVVTSDCGDMTVDSTPVSFTTDSCDAVTDVVISDITLTSATVSWTASATASEGYEVNVYEAGTTNLVTTETAAAGETSVDLTGLDAATAYDVVVTSDCGDVTVDTASVSFTTMSCDAVAIAVYDITQTTATVMWTASGTAEEYIVTVTEEGTEVSSDIVVGATSFDLNGLDSATEYEVVVTSDCGEVMVDSDAFTFTTLSCDAVIDIVVTDITETTATVSWSGSATASDGYEVNVYEAGTTDLVTTEMANAWETSVEITGLTPDTTYDVVITSDCGEVMVDSDAVSFTTEETICEAATDIEVTDITATTAMVSWTTTGYAIDGYIVEVYIAGADTTVNDAEFSVTVGATATSAMIEALSPETTYDVYITSGCGVPNKITSEPVRFTTGEIVCEAVTDIEVIDIDATSATVTWTVTDFAIDGYLVEVYLEGADPTTDDTVFDVTVGEGVTSTDITDLTPDTTYDLYITSGCGIPNTVTSDVVTFTTEATTSVGDFDFGSLEVFPNPAVNDLYISATRVIEEIQVYNILGQLVMTQKFNAAEVTLDVSSLSTATYVLRVQVDGVMGTVRFVKK